MLIRFSKRQHRQPSLYMCGVHLIIGLYSPEVQSSTHCLYGMAMPSKEKQVVLNHVCTVGFNASRLYVNHPNIMRQKTRSINAFFSIAQCTVISYRCTKSCSVRSPAGKRFTFSSAGDRAWGRVIGTCDVKSRLFNDERSDRQQLQQLSTNQCFIVFAQSPCLPIYTPRLPTPN
jgi:hypothetical protein